MARLRNRIRKADYFSDGELLRWPRDKRATYSGLWAIAEDSGCLEDDPFAWKMLIWGSPLDSDITVEQLTQWRDELIEAGKLIPYESDGKHYLFIRTFHQHELPRNPAINDLPLPEWVTRETTEGVDTRGRRFVRHHYTDHKYTDHNRYGTCTGRVQAESSTGIDALPCPVLPCPDQSCTDTYVSEDGGETVGDLFETDFWTRWPLRKGSKQLARKRFGALTTAQQQRCLTAEGFIIEALDSGLLAPQFLPRAENFIGGTKCYYREWADGIPEHLTARGRGQRSGRAVDSAFGALREVARQLDDEKATA